MTILLSGTLLKPSKVRSENTRVFPRLATTPVVGGIFFSLSGCEWFDCCILVRSLLVLCPFVSVLISLAASTFVGLLGGVIFPLELPSSLGFSGLATVFQQLVL